MNRESNRQPVAPVGIKIDVVVNDEGDKRYRIGDRLYLIALSDLSAYFLCCIDAVGEEMQIAMSKLDALNLTVAIADSNGVADVVKLRKGQN